MTLSFGALFPTQRSPASVELPAAITVPPEPCSVTDLLPAAAPSSQALPGLTAGAGGHGRATVPLVFPFRARLVEQGPKASCCVLRGAGCPLPDAPCSNSATPSLKVSAVSGSAAASSGRTTALPSCAPSLHPDYTGKGAGMARYRLCLQLLNQAVWKPYI